MIQSRRVARDQLEPIPRVSSQTFIPSHRRTFWSSVLKVTVLDIIERGEKRGKEEKAGGGEGCGFEVAELGLAALASSESTGT